MLFSTWLEGIGTIEFARRDETRTPFREEFVHGSSTIRVIAGPIKMVALAAYQCPWIMPSVDLRVKASRPFSLAF